MTARVMVITPSTLPSICSATIPRPRVNIHTSNHMSRGKPQTAGDLQEVDKVSMFEVASGLHDGSNGTLRVIQSTFTEEWMENNRKHLKRNPGQSI